MHDHDGDRCDNCGSAVLATKPQEDDGSLYCDSCEKRLREKAEAAEAEQQAHATEKADLALCDEIATQLNQTRGQRDKLRAWLIRIRMRVYTHLYDGHLDSLSDVVLHDVVTMADEALREAGLGEEPA